MVVPIIEIGTIGIEVKKIQCLVLDMITSGNVLDVQAEMSRKKLDTHIWNFRERDLC